MIDPPAAPALRRRALVLVVVTMLVYAAEAVVALALGLASGSPALLGLGLDSAVKAVGGAVLGWELGGHWDTRQEQLALRLLSAAFFLAAAYLLGAGIAGLLSGRAPEVASAGLVAAAAGALLLPPLVVVKRAVADRLGSATLRSDADKTRLYALLCLTTLLGLLLHRTLGWWWADPVASLGIAVVAVVEGWQDWIEARELEHQP